MGVNRLSSNTSAIGVGLAMVIIGGLLIGGIAVYQITQRPDITYNISDTGFSLAGVDVSWFAIIGAVVIIIIIILFLMRRRPAQQPQIRWLTPPERRF